MQKGKNKINKSSEKEKQINSQKKEVLAERGKWEKPIIHESDVALYCMSEG